MSVSPAVSWKNGHETALQVNRLHGQHFLSVTADLCKSGAVLSSEAHCHVADHACCRYTCVFGKPAACNVLLF